MILRLAIFYLLSILAGGFSNILAYGLMQMNNLGGLKGWQWIFVSLLTTPSNGSCADLDKDHRRSPHTAYCDRRMVHHHRFPRQSTSKEQLPLAI
jgi:hypothetical protein